jgi:hypothetical protein
MSVERVTYRPEGARAKTVYLQNPKVVEVMTGAPALVGQEVDKEGNAVLGTVAQAIERQHVISLELVVKRVPVAMSMIYAEFVEEQP